MITTTIAKEYVPGWGSTEGLRELLQNWMDASDATGQPGTVHYSEDTQTLRLNNPGATMGREALLLGSTTKVGTEQRGQFGEGFKLGALALLRTGHEVHIYVPGEAWTAMLIESPEFPGREVLAWEITTREPAEGVSVVVTGLDWREWSNAENRILRFRNIQAKHDCAAGTVLLDEAEAGRIYVRGILVQSIDVDRGYDLATATVDRDRQIVNTFDVNWHCAQMLARAAEAGMVDAVDVLRAIEEDDADATYLTHASMSADMKNKIADAFEAVHGKNVIPVSAESPDHATRLQSLGLRTVQVPANAAKVLAATRIPSAAATIQQGEEAPRETFATEDLTPSERSALVWAREHTGENDVQIVTFAGDVRAKCADKRILIARYALTDGPSAVAAILYGQALRDGGDHRLAWVLDRVAAIVRRLATPA